MRIHKYHGLFALGSLLLAVLIACSDSPNELEYRMSCSPSLTCGPDLFSVGPAGGIVRFDDVASVVVAAGALSEYEEFIIQPASVYYPDALLACSDPVAIDFPVEALVTLSYEASAIPNQVLEPELRLHKLIESGWQEVSESTVDTSSNTVSGRVAGTTTVCPRGVNASSVTVSPPSTSVLEGRTVTLTATVHDAIGGELPRRHRTWSSSNADVAIVDATSGVVIGGTPGSVTVYAKSAEVAGSAQVTVTSSGVGSVVVTPDEDTLIVGETIRLMAEVRDQDGNALIRSVEWDSQDPEVAGVSALGVVSAVDSGTTVVSATSEGQIGTATIKVNVAPVRFVSVTPGNVTLEVGASEQFAAVVQDAANNPLYDREVDWSSTDETVATVDLSGFVTAIAEGQVSISAEAEGVIGTADLTVALTPVDSVIVTPNAFSLLVGQTLQLNAAAIDAAGDTLPNRLITWATSDAAVATVGSEGLVTGVAIGAATIQASAGEGQPGSTSVSVTDVPSSEFPNEPPGFARISERALSELATCDEPFSRIDGWDDKEACSTLGSLVEDWSARKSPPSVYEMRYPAGFAGGTGAGLLQKSFVGGPFTKVYLSMWVRLSSNWQGHQSNTNKMFFVWIGSEPRFFISAEGSDNGPLVPELRLQGSLPDPRPHLVPNASTSKRIERGVWQRWELVLQCNTPGAADGQADWWIDGVKVSDYDDIGWVQADESCDWQFLQVRAVWGGIGDTVVEDMNLRWDHIYMSGSN